MVKKVTKKQARTNAELVNFITIALDHFREDDETSDQLADHFREEKGPFDDSAVPDTAAVMADPKVHAAFERFVASVIASAGYVIDHRVLHPVMSSANPPRKRVGVLRSATPSQK